MIQQRKLLKLSFVCLFSLWVVVYYFNGAPVGAFSSGPPASRIGAPILGTFPAEPTCADCHTSFPLNSGTGILTINGLPASYSPNQEVAVTVTLMQPNRMRYGFEATALDDQGNKAGDLVLTDPTRTQLISGSGNFTGRQYIEHTFAGVTPNGTDQNSWIFTWRAPAQSVGRVTFYVAGNAADGTGSSAGDFIYTTSASVMPAAPPSGLVFFPLAHPVRLLDTRPGFTGCDAPGAPISAGTSRLQTARRTCDGLTIPDTAMAITGNITTVESGGGYLTLYPSDAAQPLVANSNYNPNEILNNVFTVGLGSSDGAFKIFVTSTTNVVVDVTGYYAPPATGGLYFHPLPKPIRLLETRMGFTGCNAPGAPLPGNMDTTQQARLVCDGVTIPDTALAIVGNATTVNPAGPGFPYLTLFPADANAPLAASSNYQPGQVMNAPFTVGLSPAGEFKIHPTTQTDLVIDVLGYYSADAGLGNGTGLLFNPLPSPVRLLETRAGFTGCYAPGTPLLAGSTRQQQARGACGGQTIADNALAIVGNATVVNSNGGYLTFWPEGAAQPLVASSNFAAGQILNRHFTVGLGATGMFNIFTQFQTDLVIDVSGYFAP